MTSLRMWNREHTIDVQCITETKEQAFNIWYMTIEYYKSKGLNYTIICNIIELPSGVPCDFRKGLHGYLDNQSSFKVEI